MEVPPDDVQHARELGARLRHVRQQQQYSLHDVEGQSGGELKASVVGAYERGERTISISRLGVMAEFYRVPIAELLPDPTHADLQGAGSANAHSGQVVIDLVALEERRDDEPVLVRYVESIRSRRGDYNGRILTVRSADLHTLAAVMDTAPERLRARLIDAGLVR